MDNKPLETTDKAKSQETKPKKSRKKVHVEYNEDGKRICGAKTRAGNKCQCSPMANGRCRLHGGKSTGPTDPSKLIGNQNAFKTGEYSSILQDGMTEEERALFETSIELDKYKALVEELKLITIRERRMLIRLNELQELKYITQEKEEEYIEITKDGQVLKPMGVRKNVKTISTMGIILEQEEALTRVQIAKSRILESMHKIEIDAEKNGYNDRIQVIIKGGDMLED